MRQGIRCSLFLLMARIVLGSALFFGGWYLIFGSVDVTADDLRSLDAAPAVAVESQSATSTATVQRQPVVRTALALHAAGVNEGAWVMAWIIALVQLIGGGLLVVGLLTRIWSLCAIAAMGCMFWAMSIEGHEMFDRSPLSWAADWEAYAGLYVDAMGIVVAIALVVAGPGRMSFDHLLFAKPQRHGVEPGGPEGDA